jgi:predicted nucleic acid-binding protein
LKQVFVDTSGFYALIVRRDDNHARAHQLFTRAAREKWRLVTTNAVLFETYALLLARARPAREVALKFLDSVEARTYDVERLTIADEDRAIALIRSHVDKTYSLCDASSFAVMERLGIAEAIAFDTDFQSYGRFVIL